MKQLACVWLGLLLVCGGAAAQTGASRTITEASVRAHEEFLAGDGMHGRGSATVDEEAAADYVGRAFASYGLQHAPGLQGYQQAAEVVGPQLNGHATLTAEAGRVQLQEGPDFTLVLSSGKSVSGPLQRVQLADATTAKVPAGAVVEMVGPTGDQRHELTAVMALDHAGAAAVLVANSPVIEGFLTRAGGKTRLPVALKDAPEPWHYGTLAEMDPAAMAEVDGIHEGDKVTLTVHPTTPAEPRMTYNAVGYLPGRDPEAGTILLSAHLDHLGIGRPVNGDGTWNGANDDAAGTTAVLELAQALASGPPLRRSVLFVCYGSEELGELGSTYFGEHPPVPLKSLVANLEFEMIGNQDPKMPKGVLLLTGWGRSNLGPELRAHGALLGPDPYPEEHFFERSDNYALALKGVVAHTAAGWGTPPTYHQPDDDVAHLDIPFMTAAIQSLVGPVRWLADSSFVPRWHTGGQPHGQ